MTSGKCILRLCSICFGHILAQIRFCKRSNPSDAVTDSDVWSPGSRKERFASVFAQTLSKMSRRGEKNSHNSLGLSLNKDLDSLGSSSACTWRQAVWWSATRQGEQSRDSRRTSAVGARRQQTAEADVRASMAGFVLCQCGVSHAPCGFYSPGLSGASTTTHKQLSTGHCRLTWPYVKYWGRKKSQKVEVVKLLETLILLDWRVGELCSVKGCCNHLQCECSLLGDTPNPHPTNCFCSFWGSRIAIQIYLLYIY